MKTNGIKHLLTRIFAFTLVAFNATSAYAQPDYDFRNPVLIGGTDLQIGAQYLFSNVKPGVDGIITITDITGNMTLNQLDGPSGFLEAFQPYINCANKQTGYVEFQLDFVIGGTNTPMVQQEVPLTAIDIDGYEFPDDKLYELDQFMISPNYDISFDMLGTSLTINQKSNWYEVENTSAITYNGIDTVQRNVMFTMIHYNVSSVTFRVGAENNSTTDMLRLRSVYFKKFVFANGLLPVYGLLSFKGVNRQDKTELTWALAADCKFNNVIVERSEDGKTFSPIGTISVTHSSSSKQYNFTDNIAVAGKAYFRLKITVASGKYNYSNVLLIKGKENTVKGFSIYPNVITSEANISLYSDKKQQVTLFIADYSGRIVQQQRLNLQEGSNSMQLNQLDRLSTGNYVAVIRTESEVYNQKILVR